MALVRGKDGVVTLQATDATGVVTGTAAAVGKITAFEYEETAGITEGKFMGAANYAERAPTFLGWSGTITCLFDPADTTGQGKGLVGALVEAVFQPAGTGVGKPEVTGMAIVASVKTAQDVENYASFELSLSGTGALVRGTQ